jgi:hypothetical protein
MLSASDNDLVTLYGESPQKTIWNLKESGPRMWGHQQQNDYFVQCIKAGNLPDVKPEDGRRAMEIALQIGQATVD